MWVINDPLGQAHSTANSDHYSQFKFALFCFARILKSADGRTDTTCENSDRTLLAVTVGGLVDQ